jgi:hypothetical protein
MMTKRMEKIRPQGSLNSEQLAALQSWPPVAALERRIPVDDPDEETDDDGLDVSCDVVTVED